MNGENKWIKNFVIGYIAFVIISMILIVSFVLIPGVKFIVDIGCYHKVIPLNYCNL